MIKRWLIRSVFLLALAGGIGVWILSYVGAAGLNGYWSGRFFSVGAVKGVGFFYEVKATRPSFSWHWLERTTTFRTLAGEEPVWGFAFLPGRVWGTADSLVVGVPMWVVTVPLAVLNWFVWRKTRRTFVGRAFPVEVSSDGTDAS